MGKIDEMSKQKKMKQGVVMIRGRGEGKHGEKSRVG